MNLVEDQHRPDWREACAAKQADDAARLHRDLVLAHPPPDDVLDVTAVPRTCGLLTEREIAITDSASVRELLASLADGSYTALEVVEAFIKRAVIAQQLVHCLTETFFDDARERARGLDQHLAHTGKVVGPLHGLPISLKDHIDIEGTEFTMAFAGWIGNKATRTADIATILHKQGAALYCRTNMCQATQTFDGVNNVYKITTNPYNRGRTSGGSSAGEAALIAMRGSIVGVGSDMGGSIRNPASYCGLYGLRASSQRVPTGKATWTTETHTSIKAVLGPLCASVDGLKIFMQAVLDAEPWSLDAMAVRMPWSQTAYNMRDHGGDTEGAVGKLCFAMLWDDGFVKPTPPVRRALEEIANALEEAGHEVIPWTPYKPDECARIFNSIIDADGGHEIHTQTGLSGEPIWAGWCQDEVPETGITEYLDSVSQHMDYAQRCLEYWNASASRTSTGRPVDCIISPVMPCPPHPLGVKIVYAGYMRQATLCDYAAAVFPVTTVDPVRDVQGAPHEFRCEADRATYEAYDAEASKGTPIGLQCTGRRYEEEAVIRMTEIIAAALAKQGGDRDV